MTIDLGHSLGELRRCCIIRKMLLRKFGLHFGEFLPRETLKQQVSENNERFQSSVVASSGC